MPQPVIQSVTNYLVPGTGSPNAYLINQAFSATPYGVDFSQIGLNGLPFRPSGVFIDNSQGAGDLIVLIPEMSFAITCKAGQALMMPYPAPQNHTASITGNGSATVIFVDFPLIPYSSAEAGGGGGAVTIADGADVALGTTTDAAGAASVVGQLKQISTNTTPGAAKTFTAAITTVSAAGNVAAGAVSAAFLNSGAAAVTVAGGSLPAGQIVNFEAPAGGTLNAIAYDGTGSTLVISTLR